jgi:membrane-bound lytic murein transglycosylase A
MKTASRSATSTSMTNQTMARLLPNFAWAFVGALCVACSTVPPGVPNAVPPPAAATEPGRALLRPVAFRELPGWADDTLADAWPAFIEGCSVLLAQAATASTWQEPCAAATNLDPRDTAAVRAFFERHFTAYQALTSDGQDAGLVTGYYEPLLHGSRVRSERNRYPLYAPPDDLLTVDLAELYPELKDKRLRGRVDGKRVVPYWPRADIEGGRVPLEGKALVFVDDPVEAFFLQIQGSGRVQLDEGGVMRVGYADQNGRPFRSVAGVLIDRGQLSADGASMQAIKQWARQHPDAVPALLDENPSYVFFREVTLDSAAPIDGPIGAFGIPLAAGRAIAVDPRSIPLGAPVFLATTWPLSSRPLQRLVLAQDTGGAIRGPLRVDFFWGFGDDAGFEAGRMKQAARLWLLWPKDAVPPRAPISFPRPRAAAEKTAPSTMPVSP